jgi:hypothetical protein
MTLSTFLSLSDHRKNMVIMQKAISVASRKEGHYEHVLFQIEGFYVEVVYELYPTELWSLRAFDNTDELAPYLEQMEITL